MHHMIIFLVFHFQEISGSLSQYSAHPEKTCISDDTITISTFTEGVSPCEFICSRIEYCTGFTFSLNDQGCGIKFKQCDNLVDSQHVTFYGKPEHSLIQRHTAIVSKSNYIIIPETHTPGHDFSYFTVPSAYMCSYICSLNVECKSCVWLHLDRPSRPGYCYLKNLALPIPELSYASQVTYFHKIKDPYQNLKSLETLYTTYQSTSCVEDSNQVQIFNTVNTLTCLELCTQTPKCIGIVHDDSSSATCHLKAACERKPSGTNVKLNLIKRKDVCTGNFSCYTVVLDRMVMHHDALEVCRNMSQNLVTFETQQEYLEVMKKINKSIVSPAILWTSLTLNNEWGWNGGLNTTGWIIPWSPENPGTDEGAVYGVTNLISFESMVATDTAYVMCEKSMYGHIYRNEETHFINILNDKDFSTCLTEIQITPQMTWEIPRTGYGQSNSRQDFLVYLYGSHIASNSTDVEDSIHVMVETSLSKIKHPPNIINGTYERCLFELGGIAENDTYQTVFYCRCKRSNCPYVYLKVLGSVQLCEVWVF